MPKKRSDILAKIRGLDYHNLINRIHERDLRIAYNDYTSDFDNLLSRDDAVTIHQRNIQALAIEIHKTLNNLNPIFMKEIFSLNEHKYSTRRQSLNSILRPQLLTVSKHLGLKLVKSGTPFLMVFRYQTRLK